MNTPLNSQAHYDLIEQFEKNMRSARGIAGIRTEKESKEMWKRGNVYQDGLTNQLFLAFRLGSAYGSATAVAA